MPSPKVFVSSTCYDLGMVREQLRNFLLRLGHDPILSEYSDVLYDPRTHTHTSCLQEVPNADMIILLIGSRFGGQAVPEAVSDLDYLKLQESSGSVSVLSKPEKLSITQLEVLKAVEVGIPVFAFVDEKVYHDYHVYTKNRELVDKINFPSIERPETAKYIFEFISFLGHRTKGNSVTSFSRLEDIESHLTKQWSALFQRLLKEQRDKSQEVQRMFTISEQIEELKTVLLSSIEKSSDKDVARGVLRYRRLVDFLLAFRNTDSVVLKKFDGSFDLLLEQFGVKGIENFRRSADGFPRTALILEDGTYYDMRYPIDMLGRLAGDWEGFRSLSESAREVIIGAVADMGTVNSSVGSGILRFRDEQFTNEPRNDHSTETPPEAQPTLSTVREITNFLASMASPIAS